MLECIYPDAKQKSDPRKHDVVIQILDALEHSNFNLFKPLKASRQFEPLKTHLEFRIIFQAVFGGVDHQPRQQDVHSLHNAETGSYVSGSKDGSQDYSDPPGETEMELPPDMSSDEGEVESRGERMIQGKENSECGGADMTISQPMSADANLWMVKWERIDPQTAGFAQRFFRYTNTS
jgi:hypothetical protein